MTHRPDPTVHDLRDAVKLVRELEQFKREVILSRIIGRECQKIMSIWRSIASGGWDQ